VPLDDALRDAAERNGVQQDFFDIFGGRHYTTPDTNRAILTALGFDCASEESLRASLDRLRETEKLRLLPPVLVVSENAPLRIPASSARPAFDLDIITEQGAHHRVHIENGIPQSDLRLPLGYHEARVSGSSAGDKAAGCTMRLIVTPDCAHSPEPGKHAGLGITLYGLRSDRNWGVGDFRDLHDLIDWAVPTLQVDFIALNPLHAIHNRLPYNTSPYLPNSIYYRNFLYLDVEDVPGFDRISAQLKDAEACAELARLRDSPTVQYEQVAALKRRALDLIFAVCPPSPECEKWIAEESDLLRLYATYCALDEHLHSKNPDLWVWPDWPAPYRDPASDAVRQFAAEHEREILFHGWLQWNVDRQLAAVQQHARQAGMGIGLYHDLALATDRCGSGLWAHRKFYVAGCRVGSPPDDFSPTGQDWSFPPPDARQHREDGYRLYTESIRKSLRHGGALRIDHVMRFFRLYWIPEGHDAAHGAYVRDLSGDLVRILALESVRNQAVIVGEDLGTVETAVRETLAGFGILSYRLLYFERVDGRFKSPAEYPAQSLASSTTHDLATITGFWTSQDIEARFHARTIDHAAFEAQKHDRARDKQSLLDALFDANLLPPGYTRNAADIPELTGELHYAIIGYLARTPSVLWLVNQEDMTKEPAQQNLPGTTFEYPNWSRKMDWSIKDLTGLKVARDCATMVRHWIDTTGRAIRPQDAEKPLKSLAAPR
jgi:4-alpha-glucanotransferase